MNPDMIDDTIKAEIARLSTRADLLDVEAAELEQIDLAALEAETDAATQLAIASRLEVDCRAAQTLQDRAFKAGSAPRLRESAAACRAEADALAGAV